MAYNFGYPYQYPQQQMQQPMQQQMQIQNGGFVSVRSEAEARNYPVAYGNSITFKDETAPYVYTKTMGFSQLDRPVFEKFKLVREDAQEPISEPKNSEVENSVIDAIKGEIADIWAEIHILKDHKSQKEVVHDE